jgi:hypothetical protein
MNELIRNKKQKTSNWRLFEEIAFIVLVGGA